MTCLKMVISYYGLINPPNHESRHRPNNKNENLLINTLRKEQNTKYQRSFQQHHRCKSAIFFDRIVGFCCHNSIKQIIKHLLACYHIILYSIAPYISINMSSAPLSKKPRTSASSKNDDDGIPVPEMTSLDYVNLTSHTDAFGVDPIPVSWGHPDPLVRGPVICTVRHSSQRNAIGAHSGSYCIYTGLAVAAGKLNPDYVPNLKLTRPVFQIGPHKSWSDPKKVASIDPFGHVTTDVYSAYLNKGFDIRPTIAITKAHIDLPETREAVAAGRLIPDGKILMPNGQSIVSKAAIEPVWYLPEIARRFGCTETMLRQVRIALLLHCYFLFVQYCLAHHNYTYHLLLFSYNQSIFRMTNGMYPELITRPDIKIFLPPIGGLTIYIWGDPDTIPDEDIELTCRVHDECNGSDVSVSYTFFTLYLAYIHSCP